MSAFFNQNHPGQHVENSFTCTQIGKAMGFPSKSGHGTLLSRRSNLYFRFFLFVLLLPHLPFCEGIVQCISHQLSQCMGNGWLVNRFWHFNQIQATHTHTHRRNDGKRSLNTQPSCYSRTENVCVWGWCNKWCRHATKKNKTANFSIEHEVRIGNVHMLRVFACGVCYFFSSYAIFHLSLLAHSDSTSNRGHTC